MEDVAQGQRIIIYAILVNIAAIAVSAWIGDIWIVLGLLSAGLAVVGVVRLATGLGFSTPTKVLLVIVVFIPLASLITLALLSSRATRALRAGGYKVGFFGARR